MNCLRMLLCTLVAMTVSVAPAQVLPSASANPADEPAVTQIRKTVAFIALTCKEGTTEFDVRGTGFFVFYPDSRLGKGEGFTYLVTNRHVALCWNDDAGHAMQVENVRIRLNRRQAERENFSQDVFLNEHGNVPWVVPSDDSVDLAIVPLHPDEARFDYKTIPTGLFATRDVLSERKVTEGEPVFFAGFFQQFPGSRRMQPIVRQGIVAMMPDEKVPFVVKPEELYLADVHVFGGNSGAPAFVNLGGFHGGSMFVGQDYRLLGIVNGFLFEDEHFRLRLATTLMGKLHANSGISTIVPVDKLKTLLEDPQLQSNRDAQASWKSLWRDAKKHPFLKPVFPF